MSHSFYYNLKYLPGLRGGRPCRSGISGEPGGAGRSSDPPGGQKIFQEVKIFWKLTRPEVCLQLRKKGLKGFDRNFGLNCINRGDIYIYGV